MFLQQKRNGKPNVEVLGKYTIMYVHVQVYEKIDSDVVGTYIRAAFAKPC